MSHKGVLKVGICWHVAQEEISTFGMILGLLLQQTTVQGKTHQSPSFESSMSLLMQYKKNWNLQSNLQTFLQHIAQAITKSA